MSSYGWYTLRLRAQRLAELRRQWEETRRQHVRQEAVSLLSGVQQVGARFQHHLTQLFGQHAQRGSADLARQAQALLRSDPDQALHLARKATAAVERGLQHASQKAAAWTQAKTEAQESVTLLKLALDSLLRGASTVDGADPALREAIQSLRDACAAMRREDFVSAKAVAQKGQEQVQRLEKARHQAEEQEAVRREVVRGLRQVLTEMGFEVENPSKDSDRVILVGTLPSGRTARFEILLDGQVKYDFDGYQHRECGKHREAIRHRLEQLCDAAMPEAHDLWKDELPLQIGAHYLDLPGIRSQHRRS